MPVKFQCPTPNFQGICLPRRPVKRQRPLRDSTQRSRRSQRSRPSMGRRRRHAWNDCRVCTRPQTSLAGLVRTRQSVHARRPVRRPTPRRPACALRARVALVGFLCDPCDLCVCICLRIDRCVRSSLRRLSRRLRGEGNPGRVERRRRGCRSQVGTGASFRATPQSCRPYPVSGERSSNRACRFPAHGSRTGFTPGHATAELDAQSPGERGRRRRRPVRP